MKFRIALKTAPDSKSTPLRGDASDPSTFTFGEEGEPITFESHAAAVEAAALIETMPGEWIVAEFVSTSLIAVAIPGPSLNREEFEFTGTYQEAVDRVHALYRETRRTVTLSTSPSGFWHRVDVNGEVTESNRNSGVIFPAGYPVVKYAGHYAAGIGRKGAAEIEVPTLGNDHPLTRDMTPGRFGVNRPLPA